MKSSDLKAVLRGDSLKRLSRLVMLLGVLLAPPLAWSIADDGRSGQQPSALQPAMDFTLPAVRNGSRTNLRLQEMRGAPVLLAFATSWCKECVRDFQRAEIMLSARDQSAALWIVRAGEARHPIDDRWMERLDTAVLRDERADIARQFKVRHSPEWFCVTADGVVQRLGRDVSAGSSSCL